jgi:hypothetical protein
MKTPLLFATLTVLLGSTTPLWSAALTLAPADGVISGNSGSTTGWGFTLSNPADFAVISSSDFCLGTTGLTSLCEAPTLGTYSDYVSSNFTIVGAAPESPVVTELFNAGEGTGIGSFTFASEDAVGATDIGQIVITYDLYSVDPLSPSFNPDIDLISAGNFLDAPATVIVAPAVTEIPEPSYLPLLTLLGGALVLSRASRLRHSNQRSDPGRKAEAK